MITVLGAGGFVGSHIVKLLLRNKIDHYAPFRNEPIRESNLGDIIYCIGLTADFRSKPFETVEAHVCKLSKILNKCSFKSFTYLSSTRVYINCTSAEVKEDAIIPVNPLHADELYTLTKLTGERICLSSGKKTRIVRLSNVYGNDPDSENFLTDVIKNVMLKKAVSFKVTISSAKDYIHVGDVANLLLKIAVSGQSEIYNIASGFNTSNETIIDELKKYFDFSVDLSLAEKAIIFPRINIEKIKQEFNYTPTNITTFIPDLIKSHNVSN